MALPAVRLTHSQRYDDLELSVDAREGIGDGQNGTKYTELS